MGEGEKSSLKDQPATIAEPIKSEISCWNLDKQNSVAKPVFVDSSMINFHIYNPMNKQNVSTTFLGYLGAPFISNSFFEVVADGTRIGFSGDIGNDGVPILKETEKLHEMDFLLCIAGDPCAS